MKPRRKRLGECTQNKNKLMQPNKEITKVMKAITKVIEQNQNLNAL